MKSIIVAEGQTIYDIVAKHYGKTDVMLSFLQANAFTYNTVLVSGQEVYIPTLDNRIELLDLYTKQAIDINSNDPTFGGDFNSRDFNSRDFKAL